MLGPAQKSKGKGGSVAVIDIGSNSVRLVVYEALTRSLSPIFNEKVLAGLGRNVQTTRQLPEDAVAKALGALQRFRALCAVMKVGRIYAIATAACRDAENGPDFIDNAERICGVSIEVLSGEREAALSAMGVISSVHAPNGIVGDLGGGSLEVVDIRGHRLGRGRTLPLGGLALQDLSKRSLKRAEAIVKEQLQKAPLIKAGRGRTFYAVGGTWRALARLHIIQSGHPLRVMHGYRMSPAEALFFLQRVRRYAPRGVLADVEEIADQRRPLLAYGALVLEHIIRIARPREIVMSTFGVREGLLFAELPEKERAKDGLMEAVRDLNRLRSRSPAHAADLIAWSDSFMRVVKVVETPEEKRLRHATCLLADLGWRAHPDYRGEQSLNLIANANLSCIDHEGRVFMALTVYYRYAGLADEGFSQAMLDVLSPRMIERAKLLGAFLRVAYLVSAAQAGVLPKVVFRSQGKKLLLVFDKRRGALAGDRVISRFKQLARLVGRSPVVVRG